MADFKEMQASHKGFVEKRTWHKIKWTTGDHKGKFDLFDDEDLAKHKDSVHVVETFKTDMCTTGVTFGFGRTSEEHVDKWIRENKR
ncbi:MAG TPA: hypothetical protein VJH04_01350 [archaeon]|nr:hypothetical protein [archaeon]